MGERGWGSEGQSHDQTHTHAPDTRAQTRRYRETDTHPQNTHTQTQTCPDIDTYTHTLTNSSLHTIHTHSHSETHISSQTQGHTHTHAYTVFGRPLGRLEEAGVEMRGEGGQKVLFLQLMPTPPASASHSSHHCPSLILQPSYLLSKALGTTTTSALGPRNHHQDLPSWVYILGAGQKGNRPPSHL